MLKFDKNTWSSGSKFQKREIEKYIWGGTNSHLTLAPNNSIKYYIGLRLLPNNHYYNNYWGEEIKDVLCWYHVKVIWRRDKLFLNKRVESEIDTNLSGSEVWISWSLDINPRLHWMVN